MTEGESEMREENSSRTSLTSPLLIHEPDISREEDVIILAYSNGREPQKSDERWFSSTRTEVLKEEARKQLWLAGPLISVGLLTYSLHIISLMFVGHLGEVPLSGASMATSFAYVTGFSFVLGMASALETTCGQAYGAEQYHMLGVHTQRAIFTLLLVCIPLGLIWANTRTILIFLGQDHIIATEAAGYTQCMIPGLFAYTFLQCIIRFLQTQNIVIPMMLSSGIASLIHLLGCWVMVYRLDFGIRGAALASSVSYWVNAVLLVIYVEFSPSCSKTWTGLSMAAFHGIPGFLRLAVPSALMVCLEMWSFEMIVLISGLLPNPALETSVLSICLNTTSLAWVIPEGLSGAISTRVSNELGAGRAKGAQLAVDAVLLMTIGESIIVGLLLLMIRNLWGYAYSNEMEVVNYLAAMMPLIAITNVMDGLACVLSGVARGCGWQKIGAFINLGSFYIAGIPCATMLAFTYKMGGVGLWLGILLALFIQVAALFGITIRTNWEQETRKAEERISQSQTIPEVSSV